MAKMINIPKETIAEMIREFTEKISSAKSFEGGKFTYTKEFKSEKTGKAKIIFTPEAYSKMITLVNNFDSEVAWYGYVDRVGDASFKISDVFVYPQVVTGVNVDTDEDEHRAFLEKIPDEDYNRIRFQGHSHVNMGTSPSGTDLTDQATRVGNSSPDTFWVFVIWNKKNEHNAKIYDLANNVLYENGDIDVSIEFDNGEFLEESKKLVKTKTYTYHGTGAYNSSKKSGTHDYGYGGYGGCGSRWEDFWDNYDYPYGNYGKKQDKKNESEDYSKTKNSVKAEVISGGITEDIDLEEEYADDGFVKELRVL